MPAHNLYWSDPTLWPRVQAAAREAAVREERKLSASEWIAEAALARLEAEAGTRKPRA